MITSFGEIYIYISRAVLSFSGCRCQKMYKVGQNETAWTFAKGG